MSLDTKIPWGGSVHCKVSDIKQFSQEEIVSGIVTEPTLKFGPTRLRVPGFPKIQWLYLLLEGDVRIIPLQKSSSQRKCFKHVAGTSVDGGSTHPASKLWGRFKLWGYSKVKGLSDALTHVLQGSFSLSCQWPTQLQHPVATVSMNNSSRAASQRRDVWHISITLRIYQQVDVFNRIVMYWYKHYLPGRVQLPHSFIYTREQLNLLLEDYL